MKLDKWLEASGTFLPAVEFEPCPPAWDDRGMTIVLSCRRCGALDGRISRSTDDMPGGWRNSLTRPDAKSERVVTICAVCVADLSPTVEQLTLL
jgi:hypothetical protein